MTQSSPEATVAWLDKQGIKNYTLTPGGSVNVKGSVNIAHQNLEYIPVNFNKVEGDFICNNMGLKSLKGSPDIVLGHFYCSQNTLTSLEGGPSIVDKTYNCSYNQLIDLSYIASIIKGDLVVSSNQLDNVDNLPVLVSGSLNLENNSKLGTLQFFKSWAELNLFRDISQKIKSERNLILQQIKEPIFSKELSDQKNPKNSFSKI